LIQELAPKSLRKIRKAAPKPILRKLKQIWMRQPKYLAYKWGRYPQFFAYSNLRKLAKNPETLRTKIRHRMAYDRRQLITRFSDKLAVREYVKEKVGEKYLPKIFAVWERNQNIDWEKLPTEFVAKSTHGVGASIIVWEGAVKEEMATPLDDVDWRINLVNPKSFSRSIAEKFFKKWVNQKFERYLALYPEWGYRNIPPRVIFEELLVTAKGRIPCDYKLFCFDGKVNLIEVDSDRYVNFSRDFFLPNWEFVPTQVTVPNSKDPIPKLQNLREMIEIAETLSAGIDFVTVDLYDLDDRIVFGEMSFYPGGGHEEFSPEYYEKWLGSLWTLPRKGGRGLRAE